MTIALIQFLLCVVQVVLDIYEEVTKLCHEMETQLCDIFKETLSLCLSEPEVLQLAVQVVAEEERY